jgi:DNA-binding NarL/FixJ family response regulator
MPIRVVIVDDDANWRLLYRLMLEKDGEIEIIAEFERAEEALEKVPSLSPDVAVVDFSLPGMTGLQFAEKIRGASNTKVILVSAHEPDYINGIGLQELPVVYKSYSEDLLQTIKTISAAPA